MSGVALAERLISKALLRVDVANIGESGIYTRLIGKARQSLYIVTSASQQPMWSDPGFSAELEVLLLDRRAQVEIVYIGEPFGSSAALDKARILGTARLYQLPAAQSKLFMIADERNVLAEVPDENRVFGSNRWADIFLPKFKDLKAQAMQI